MLYLAGLCIFSVFAVIGLFSLLHQIIRHLYKKIRCRVTIHTKDFEDELEYTIRSVAVNYPEMLINVINDGKNTDNTEILAMLSCQYPQLSIQDI